MNDNELFDASLQMNPYARDTRPVPAAIKDRAAEVWGTEDISTVVRDGAGYLVYLLTDADDEETDGLVHRLDEQGRVRCNHALCALLEGEVNKWGEEPESVCASCGTDGPCPCQLDDEPYDRYASER